MPGTNLTRDEAEARAALVSVQSYAVELDLTASATSFPVTCVISFTATEGVSTWVDFVGEAVHTVELNGIALEEAVAAYDGSRIQLAALREQNELRIEATGRFMNTGEGLHRFVDPADDEVYLYTQFEVADSRRMYPVFEQPDLKARFSLAVIAPSHWQVLSNSPTPSAAPTDTADASRWEFSPTEPISSYITAVIAGPYDVVRDSVTTRAGEIPLGVYCRKSLSQYLDADNVIDVTKRGFAFFEEEFDQPYPFEKYDQIFTPEYNMGAMENAACVTFNEVYVFRSQVTEAVVERRALTILHELAHMWFGNLVTMKWWNDLWLNESFAEWASTTAQAERTHWRDAWTTFAIVEKDWAYNQDQLSSTHPVVAPIRDLEDVEVNFDGITYAKGASALKQLVAYVGRDAFRDGLRSYFARHAWQNTTLDDLLRELETTSGRDLRRWSQAWLETSGVNLLRPSVTVDDQGRIVSAEIEQTFAAGFETLRPHRLAVGAYAVQERASQPVLERVARLELDLDGARTPITELVGMPQPDLLLLNDDDLSYAKIRLDERSLATALAHPRGFTESLPKTLTLASLWDMTRDAQMRPRDYVALALAIIPGESDSALLRALLNRVNTSVSMYVDPAVRDQLRADAVGQLWTFATAATPGSDAQLQLVTTAANMTSTGDDTAYLRALFTGAETLPGLRLDADMRWTLITGLAGANALDEGDIDAELSRDQTSTGRERAARARAAVPTVAAKEAAWQAAVENSDLSNAMVEASALGFGRAGDVGALSGFVDRYHDVLDGVQQRKGSKAIVEAIVSGFYPRALASEELRDATTAWLEKNPDAPDAVRRLVAENRDPIIRALAAQERDARE